MASLAKFFGGAILLQRRDCLCKQALVAIAAQVVAGVITTLMCKFLGL